MKQLLFSFSGSMSRRNYVAVAFVGVLLKHMLDLIVAGFLFHRPWLPLNYIFPLGAPVSIHSLSGSDSVFVATMVALSIPFAWVGLAATTKRFRTIGWPLWLVILFFVPVANIASFAVAAAWPEHPDASETASGRLQRLVPRDRLGAAVAAILGTTVIGYLFAVLGSRVFATYGWGLFAAIPFVQGALSVLIFNAHEQRSWTQDISVAMLSVLLTGAAMLAVAFEGAICIAMALPLAFAFAALGAAFAHAVTRRSTPEIASLLALILVAPVLMGADRSIMRDAPLHEVDSALVINAPPAVVWKNVIDFPAIASPTEFLFRAGVAYPERAKIIGRGAGALRYCEFSTGDFVEPITVWQAPRELAFDVRENPEPMRELSPYGNIQTPHLQGYLVSQRGEFVLQALPGGRTRLVGKTWYQHHLWPDLYWTVWSNEIIHAIHLRVLKHIKGLSERSWPRSD
jgi:uncharacterized membrane protein YhaH (DUF805 family)